MPHTSCKGREGEKNICSASQSTFLVPASNPADCKWSPDSASYHEIKKASKQVWHKKLITTLVFQVRTSGSLPKFAGWSQASHKINSGGGQPWQRHLSSGAHSRCPGCPGPEGTARLLPHLRPPGCIGMPSCLVGLWESQTAHLLCSGGAGTGGAALQRHVLQPPVPQAAAGRAGRSRPAGRRRGTEPWQKQVWASHHPRQGVQPARRWQHWKGASASEAKSWAPQAVSDKGRATSKCCWCKAEKLQAPTT